MDESGISGYRSGTKSIAAVNAVGSGIGGYMRKSLLVIMSVLALVATASPATAASTSGSKFCPTTHTPWVEARASGSVYHTAPGTGTSGYKYTTAKTVYKTMRTYGSYGSGGGGWRVDAYEGFISSHSTGCNAGQP